MTVTFRRSFGGTPYFAFASPSWNGDTRCPYYYGYIYSGTYRGPYNPSKSGIRSTDVTFSRHRDMTNYWMALGPA